MSLIPSESYSFPDHFSRTVTHSSMDEKESATLVEESRPRRKKRFSFSFRKSNGARGKVASEKIDVPVEWSEEFSAAAETAPAAAAPVEEVPTARIPEPTLTEKPAVSAPRISSQLHQGTPEPLGLLFEFDLPPDATELPEPVRKKPSAKRPTHVPQPELSLENGAAEPKPVPAPAPPVVAPVSLKPAAPAGQNGFAEKIISPEGLGQFFKPIAPIAPVPLTETNISEPSASSEISLEPALPSAPSDSTAESENGGLEVPITPELLAQLFQAMAATAPPAPAENNVSDSFALPEIVPQFVEPIAATPAPPIPPANDLYFQPDQMPLEPETNTEAFSEPTEMPPQPVNEVQEFFQPTETPAPSPGEIEEFFQPREMPQLSASEIEEFFQPRETPPQPANDVDEFFQPTEMPPQPKNEVEESFPPKKLPPQPRRAAIPPKPERTPSPIAPPEPQFRKSSVPPNLKRKVRWNKQAAQDPPLSPMPGYVPPANNDLLPPASAMPPNSFVADQEWQQQSASDVFSAFSSPPAGETVPTEIDPTPSGSHLQPQPSNGSSRRKVRREVPFESRAFPPQDYFERQQRAEKLRRFIICESIAGGLLLLMAALGLSQAFSDPAAIVVVNSLAIAAAAAAMVIPIFFFAVSPMSQTQESEDQF